MEAESSSGQRTDSPNLFAGFSNSFVMDVKSLVEERLNRKEIHHSIIRSKLRKEGVLEKCQKYEDVLPLKRELYEYGVNHHLVKKIVKNLGGE